MNPITLVIVVLLVLLVAGGLPGVYPHSYGYWPSGIFGLILLILLILLVLKLL